MMTVLPTLDEDVLGSVFFLYRSVEDARSGVEPGGAGFFVNTDEAGVIAVTHAQVIRDGYAVMKRIAKDWSETYVETRPDEWTATDPDLGVRPVEMSDVPAVSAGALLTGEHGIKPGEAAVTVSGPAGRRQVENFSPLMRFGHITSMDAGLIGVEQRGPVVMAGALAFTPSLHVLGISDGAGYLVPSWRITAALATVVSRCNSVLPVLVDSTRSPPQSPRRAPNNNELGAERERRRVSRGQEAAKGPMVRRGPEAGL